MSCRAVGAVGERSGCSRFGEKVEAGDGHDAETAGAVAALGREMHFYEMLESALMGVKWPSVYVSVCFFLLSRTLVYHIHDRCRVKKGSCLSEMMIGPGGGIAATRRSPFSWGRKNSSSVALIASEARSFEKKNLVNPNEKNPLS